MTTSVFLSHAGADIDLVRKVERHAEPLDVETYVYEDDAEPGGRLAAKLKERIRGSDAVIVLLTRASEHRPSVHAEVGIALALGKPVIPVLEVGLDPIQFVFLQGIEWIPLDVTKIDEALLAIQRALKRMKDAAKDNAQTIAAVLLIIAALCLLIAVPNDNG
jgi:nucleoside 2-deoxyribosyltransferase